MHPSVREGADECHVGRNPTVREGADECHVGRNPTVREGADESHVGRNPTVRKGADAYHVCRNPTVREGADACHVSGNPTVRDGAKKARERSAEEQPVSAVTVDEIDEMAPSLTVGFLHCDAVSFPQQRLINYENQWSSYFQSQPL